MAAYSCSWRGCAARQSRFILVRDPYWAEEVVRLLEWGLQCKGAMCTASNSSPPNREPIVATGAMCVDTTCAELDDPLGLTAASAHIAASPLSSSSARSRFSSVNEVVEGRETECCDVRRCCPRRAVDHECKCSYVSFACEVKGPADHMPSVVADVPFRHALGTALCGKPRWTPWCPTATRARASRCTLRPLRNFGC